VRPDRANQAWLVNQDFPRYAAAGLPHKAHSPFHCNTHTVWICSIPASEIEFIAKKASYKKTAMPHQLAMSKNAAPL